jgi:hypothetical protein
MANNRRELVSTNQLKSSYRKATEVYLEGENDVAIYKNYWFPDLLGKVSFIAAETGDIKVPGCKGVQRNVMEKRAAVGTRAFGICDRDANPDIEVALNADDGQFIQTNHSQNPYIYYTILLELENYLVDPIQWENIRIDTKKSKGEGKRSPDEVAGELWTHCDVLVAHAAGNLALQRHEPKGNVPDGFGATTKSRVDYENELFTKKNFTDEQKAAYFHWVKRIEAFDTPTTPPLQRVFAISRRVHGKALVSRFCQIHRIGSDLVFGVARHIPPPREIAEKLESWLKP